MLKAHTHVLPFPPRYLAPTDFVEADSFCQSIIERRMADGLVPTAERHWDARTFNGKPGRSAGCVAGFPCQAGHASSVGSTPLLCCQGLSRAGLGQGLADCRSSLLSEVWKVQSQADLHLRCPTHMSPCGAVTSLHSLLSLLPVSCAALAPKAILHPGERLEYPQRFSHRCHGPHF